MQGRKLREGATLRLFRALAAYSLLGGCLLGGGCSQLVVSTDLHEQEFVPGLQPVAHLHASNWGIYFLNLVPLIAGDCEYPGSIRCFSDQVCVDRLIAAVTRKSRALGGTHTSDLRSSASSRWTQFGLFFWLRRAEVSTNVSRGVSDTRGARASAETSPAHR